MDAITELLQHHDNMLYALAGLCLVVELSVMGMSGPLLFIGIACVITGLLVTLGLVSGWPTEALCVGVFAAFSAALLWKPLKRFQGADSVQDDSSDMIGQIVPVSEDVTALGGSIRHSGINWSARLDAGALAAVLTKEARVQITAVEGNVMIVKEPTVH